MLCVLCLFVTRDTISTNFHLCAFYLNNFYVTLSLLLPSELAEMKAQYAQEISAAHMQISDFQKTVEETLRRAEEVILLFLGVFFIQKQLFNDFILRANPYFIMISQNTFYLFVYRPRHIRRPCRRNWPKRKWCKSTTPNCTRTYRESNWPERNCTTTWRT